MEAVGGEHQDESDEHGQPFARGAVGVEAREERAAGVEHKSGICPLFESRETADEDSGDAAW